MTVTGSARLWKAVVAVTPLLGVANLFLAALHYFVTTFATLRDFVLYHADLLYLPLLYADWARGLNLVSWHLPPAPYFFPDLALYFALRTALPRDDLALLAFGLAQYLIFTLGLCFLANQMLPQAYGAARVALIVLAAILFVKFIPGLQSYSQMIFVSSHHFGVVATTPWILALVYPAQGDRFDQTRVIVAGGLAFLLSASDSLFVVQVLIPLCGALLGLGWRTPCWLGVKRHLIVVGELALAATAGWVVSYLFVWTSPPIHPATSLTDSLAGFGRLGATLGLEADAHPLHIVLAILFLAGCLGTLIVNLRCDRDRGAQTTDSAPVYFALFFVIGVPLNVAAIVFSGAFLDGAGLRYFLPLIIFSAWWGFPFLWRLPARRIPAWLDPATRLALLLGIPFLAGTVNWSQFGLGLATPYYPARARCVDELADQYGVRFGVADYWQAKPISVWSQRGVRVVQVTRELKPYFWINNTAWYAGEPEFAIVDTSRPVNDDWRLDETFLISRYGQPDEVFQCGADRILLYLGPAQAFRGLFAEVQPVVVPSP